MRDGVKGEGKKKSLEKKKKNERFIFFLSNSSSDATAPSVAPRLGGLPTSFLPEARRDRRRDAHPDVEGRLGRGPEASAEGQAAPLGRLRCCGGGREYGRIGVADLAAGRLGLPDLRVSSQLTGERKTPLVRVGRKRGRKTPPRRLEIRWSFDRTLSDQSTTKRQNDDVVVAVLSSKPSLLFQPPPPLSLHNSASLVALLATSATYHVPNWSQAARDRLKRADHAAIYLLIAGTYAPLCLLAPLPAGVGARLLSRVAAGAGAGVAQSLLWPKAPRPVAVALYVALGWAAAPDARALAASLPPLAGPLILAGGVCYTVGALCYAARWPDPAPSTFGYHE